MKRILKISAWLLVAVYLVAALSFTEREYGSRAFRGMEIRIHDSMLYRFIRPERVLELIGEEVGLEEGLPLSGLNTGNMESKLMNDRAVKSAEVYAMVDGTLIVEITQRKPVVKVIDRNHHGYYLDREGNVIPNIPGYSPHILLANGAIDPGYAKMGNVLSNEEGDPLSGPMRSLLTISVLIDDDPFWRSQIVQLYVESNGEFELIPRVGSHIIRFGSGDRAEAKLFKLRTLYDEGFNRMGWNQYEIINLKYNKQVICTKR